MSGIYILKNVYNFAQILTLASSKHLEKWDEHTLKKALDWAHYCEKIHKLVSHHGYACDINSKIVQMNALLSPSSLLTLDFDCLKVATKLFVETVLANANCSDHINRQVQRLVDSALWSEISDKMKARRPFSDVDKSLSVLWIQNQAELQTIEDRRPLTYARILMRNMLSVMMAAENEQRVKQYLQSLFDLLVTLDRGWELLVHFFVVNPECLPSELESMREPLMSEALSWMRLKTQDSIKTPILELNLDVLKQASLNSSGFLTFYLSSLEKWGHCFQPSIAGPLNEIWRDAGDTGSSHLCEHFRHLLLANGHSCHDSGKGLKPQVLKVITSNIEKSDFSVWRTVASRLLD